MHLPPQVYARLQRYVHGDYAHVVSLVSDLLDLRAGDTIVEVGCGTGSLAPRVLERGYDYRGVDPARTRIEAARVRFGDRFYLGDASSLRDLPLPRPRRFFLHGVLHHLDDRTVRSTLDVLRADTDGPILVSEPVRPARPWLNPLGELFTRLDEGRHPRRSEEWVELIGPESVIRIEHRSLWPRWPVAMLDMLVAPE